jgi:4-alpha-glucanotransferase
VDPEAWGIAPGYHAIDGEWHPTPPETVDAFLRAMGADGDTPPDPPVRVVTAGDQLALDGPTELTYENGDVAVAEVLPPDVPAGYHCLTRLTDGHTKLLIVSPGPCFLPPDLRTWGWAVQLACARSTRSWGIGDLTDLRRLAAWSARELGAGMVLLSPLHASRPGLPQEPSPYSPSSRRYRNPIYLDVEAVPGFDWSDSELSELAGRAHALNNKRIVDRDAVWAAKMTVLERLWTRFTGSAHFDEWCIKKGEDLSAYAIWCVLVEDGHHPLPPPRSPEVDAVRTSRAGRIRFHQWVQWLIDRQLASAGTSCPLVHDLAIGFDQAGADAWLWHDVVAGEVQVGAPPDEFNTRGQNWGLPPFDPWRLREAGYEPFVQTLRSNLAHAGGLRIDHVMGLFRLFWIPRGGAPADGTYVRYPWRDLLGVLALESQRAHAYVVGEDLGTVEPWVRDELAARDVLSYRVVWFEEKPPAEYPVNAMASVTTHDLPTVAGLWNGTDLDEQRRLGLEPNEASTTALRHRLASTLDLSGEERTEDVVTAVYGMLADAPSAVLVAALDDALAVDERPNMPGTTADQRPNWSLALPAPLEDIEHDARPRRLARALRRTGLRTQDSPTQE